MPGLEDTWITANTFDYVYRPIATTSAITNDCSNTRAWSSWQNIATEHDIDQLARKIYKIFSEHIKIDISEDEFMKLLKEPE